MAAFATVQDYLDLYGGALTQEQQARILKLLGFISDLVRNEGAMAGMDIDALVEASTAYASTVKIVVCDVVKRFERQSFDGDAMSQESQSGLGYSWSGSYAVPGGGFAQALMKNDLKRLGIRRQQMNTVDLSCRK